MIGPITRLIVGITALFVQTFKFSVFLAGRVTPNLYCNVLSMNIIALGFIDREPFSTQVFIALMLLPIDLIYLIYSSLKLGEVAGHQNVTLELGQARIRYPEDLFFTPSLQVEVFGLLLILFACVLSISTSQDEKRADRVSWFSLGYIYLFAFTTLLLWIFPPAIQLYTDQHLFTIWLVWIYMPSVSSPMSHKDKLVFIGSYSLALPLEIFFVTLQFAKVPSFLSFNCLRDFTYDQVTYILPQYHLSLFLNYAAHIVDCAGLLIVFMLILQKYK